MGIGNILRKSGIRVVLSVPWEYWMFITWNYQMLSNASNGIVVAFKYSNSSINPRSIVILKFAWSRRTFCIMSSYSQRKRIWNRQWSGLFHSPLAQPDIYNHASGRYLPAVRDVQRDSHWGLKNGGNSNRSREPIMQWGTRQSQSILEINLQVPQQRFQLEFRPEHNVTKLWFCLGAFSSKGHAPG